MAWTSGVRGTFLLQLVVLGITLGGIAAGIALGIGVTVLWPEARGFARGAPVLIGGGVGMLGGMVGAMLVMWRVVVRRQRHLDARFGPGRRLLVGSRIWTGEDAAGPYTLTFQKGPLVQVIRPGDTGHRWVVGPALVSGRGRLPVRQSLPGGRVRHCSTTEDWTPALEALTVGILDRAKGRGTLAVLPSGIVFADRRFAWDDVRGVGPHDRAWRDAMLADLAALRDELGPAAVPESPTRLDNNTVDPARMARTAWRVIAVIIAGTLLLACCGGGLTTAVTALAR